MSNNQFIFNLNSCPDSVVAYIFELSSLMAYQPALSKESLNS